MTENEIMREDMAYLRSKLPQAERFAGKTVVITGCAGFIGFYMTHFFAELLRSGVPIRSLVLLDSFLLGKPRWLEVLEAQWDQLEVISFDIGKDRLEDVRSAGAADYVLHMASIASPSFYRKYPIETIEANVFGLKNVLEFYRKRPLEGLLFFSSSEVYGDPQPEHVPTPETYWGHVASIGPRACYDESKRMGETLCYVYHQTCGLPARIVRPFNNYGPGMSVGDRRVPADFARAVLQGEDLVIHSDGTPTRTFCYIADAIAGYIQVLLHHEFDCFNIGMDQPEISVRELASLYAEQAAGLWAYQGRVRFEPSAEPNYMTHNPVRRCPDIGKARRLLGFRPEIGVAQGIGRYLAYLQKEQVLQP
ncbi:NAD-dependent epimerase/dehydratase family protein [Paenibacillus sp. y28]|uniref:NAD-dependent epimerase/dehydratase family protein n=1 Tax=Paenibacillus sp. y28 TaxID=3129110 RepID=UPI003016C1ED